MLSPSALIQWTQWVAGFVNCLCTLTNGQSLRSLKHAELSVPTESSLGIYPRRTQHLYSAWFPSNWGVCHIYRHTLAVLSAQCIEGSLTGEISLTLAAVVQSVVSHRTRPRAN